MKLNIHSKYRVIYADPPWRYGSKAYQDGGRDFNKLEEVAYDTMTINDLKSLPVQNITLDDAICFMWVTDSHLKDGIEVMESWGFEYKTIAFNWIKTYPSGEYCVNFAPWTLKSWEICIVGTKGAMSKYKKNNNTRGLVVANRRKHSQKPDEVREAVAELFHGEPMIELFARSTHSNWDSWGNEVGKLDQSRDIFKKRNLRG